ncbi:MAG: TetR/AcrR family transcriptional regulator [Desulfarculus sp.]|nr:TetR/AcrR family transcriptional regulator [Desulfarculus sp.]
MSQEKKLPRRERDRLRQRQEILAAAIELFSEKGYHNVSMNEIAERSEFAIGTIYKFFKSKEELYNSLMLDLSDRFHQALTKALTQGDSPVEKLRNYIRAKGNTFIDNVSVIRLYLSESRGARFSIKAGLDAEIRTRYEGVLRLSASVFKHGVESKLFNDIAHPYHLALALDSMANAFLLRWLEAPEEHPYPDNPDVILNIIFKGLLDASEAAAQ